MIIINNNNTTLTPPSQTIFFHFVNWHNTLPNHLLYHNFFAFFTVIKLHEDIFSNNKCLLNAYTITLKYASSSDLYKNPLK